jgi:O-antigen ligase
MSKKLKKRKMETGGANTKNETLSEKNNKPFLVKFIFFTVCLVLFCPLILSGNFYFPYVGLKSLYFMGLAEIVFFAWLFLILKYKYYRPRINIIITALVLFLAVLILSSLFGADFSESFWSKYERMTGLLMWLHLFVFFLAISSTFKEISDWKKIFNVSIFVAILIGVLSLLEVAKVKEFVFSSGGGTTLGNTSFLGTYLLFNGLLAFWFFLQQKKWCWKVYFLITIILMLSSMYFANANGAFLSFFGGLFLIFLLWLAFHIQSRKLRIFGKILLISSFIIGLVVLILLFVSDSPVQEKLIAWKSRGRTVNWEIAEKGFLERPLLGWGPENYLLAFTKYFNPCLFVRECGGEVWFDRTHNIILDTLLSIGLLGFLAYAGLFFALFFVLAKKYFKEKSISFATFSVFTAIPISYFVQNFVVFDMATSLMMFFLILGFEGFLANAGKEPSLREIIFSSRWGLKGFLILVFLISFSKFIISPLKADALIIKSIQAQTLAERLNFYKETLKASPLGKYQIREFFVQQSQDIIIEKMKAMQKDEHKFKKYIFMEEIKKELDYSIEELKKSEKESPLNFKSILQLSQLYNIYSFIEPSKVLLAEEYGKKALALSPKNQYAYWTLARTKSIQRDFESALDLAVKAIELEPRYFPSYEIAIQFAQMSGNLEKAKEIASRALDLSVMAIDSNPKNLSSYEAAIRIAQVSGNMEKATEIAKRAIEINSEWQEKFKELLEENK